MTQAQSPDNQFAQVSSKLDIVLGHVEVIPQLQQEVKHFKTDVATLQLEMVAAHSTLRQHNSMLSEHTVAIGSLQSDVAALKARHR